jgi:hypothetical protein
MPVVLMEQITFAGQAVTGHAGVLNMKASPRFEGGRVQLASRRNRHKK